MTRGRGVKESGKADVPAKVLVVALLHPEVASERRTVHDFPPRENAASVAEQADGEQHVENRMNVRYSTANPAAETIQGAARQ